MIQLGILCVMLGKRYKFDGGNDGKDVLLGMMTLGVIAQMKYVGLIKTSHHKKQKEMYKMNIEKMTSVINLMNCPLISLELPTMSNDMNESMKTLLNKIEEKKKNDEEQKCIREMIKKSDGSFANEDKFIDWLMHFTQFNSMIEEENKNGNSSIVISKIINVLENKSFSTGSISLGNYFIELPHIQSPSPITSKLSLNDIMVQTSKKTITHSNSMLSINPNIQQANLSNPSSIDYSNCLFFTFYLLKTKTINGHSINIILKDIKPETIAEKTKEQIKSKVTLLAQIAHEFKTPLIIVSHVIKDLAGCKTINEEKFNTIHSMAEYSLSLITDITDYSRQYHNYNIDFSFEEVDINKVVDFTFTILHTLISCHDAKSGHIIPYKFIGKDIGKIKTDKKRLQQVLINLFNNAFKFTNSGSIILKVNKTAPYLYNKKNLRQRYYVENERSYTFTIEDTGIGIESGNNSNKIFEEYHIENNIETKRNNQTGSGLGLSIVKKIVSTLGDEISYTTIAYRGTTFTFNIFDYDEEFEENFSKLNLGKDIHCSNMNLNKEIEGNNKILLMIKNSGLNTTPNLNHTKSFWKIHSQSVGSDNIIIQKDHKKNTQLFLKRNIDYIQPPQFRNSAYIQIKLSSKLSRNKSCFYSSENKQNASKTPNQPNSTLSNIGQSHHKRSQILFEQQDIVNSPFNFNDSDQSDDSNSDSNSLHSASTIEVKDFRLETSHFTMAKNKIVFEESFSIFSIIDFPINFHQSQNKVAEYISITESSKSDLIIIVDDNKIMRKCLTKTINQCVISHNLNMQIIGFADGFELLYAVYYDQLIGKRIRFVFTDEKMHVLNGLESYRILNGNSQIDLSYLNFFVISSYNSDDLIDINKNNIQILNKPVNKQIIDSIFETYANSLP